MVAVLAVATAACGAATPAVIAPFPLRVESGTRYLVDARGAPFLVHGDTAWSLIAQLTRDETQIYLQNRRRKHFNAILVSLIEHQFAERPPLNAYGAAPFRVAGDFSTPNDAYFAHAEWVIERAAENGILVILAPAYLGYRGGSQGWYQEMKANGAGKLRSYGQYLGSRFKRHDNIVWVHGGDYDPPERAQMDAVMEGIRDVDARWLHTFHGSRGTAALEFIGQNERWLQVNTIYTGRSTVVDDALVEYRRSTLPFILVESAYEGENADAAGVRQQAYQAMLSGAAGHFIGHRAVWRFDRSWRRALEAEGAATMPHLRWLLEARSWWNLRPETALLTGGMESGGSRAAAAIASNRASAIVYSPTVRPLTVDLRQLAGPRVSARWFDPVTRAFTTVRGSPFVATRSQAVVPVGNNAGGAGDWVLVLQAVP